MSQSLIYLEKCNTCFTDLTGGKTVWVGMYDRFQKEFFYADGSYSDPEFNNWKEGRHD